jgi:hypothetical protein
MVCYRVNFTFMIKMHGIKIQNKLRRSEKRVLGDIFVCRTYEYKGFLYPKICSARTPLHMYKLEQMRVKHMY